jgi:hypothetical protein
MVSTGVVSCGSRGGYRAGMERQPPPHIQTRTRVSAVLSGLRPSPRKSHSRGGHPSTPGTHRSAPAYARPHSGAIRASPAQRVQRHPQRIRDANQQSNRRTPTPHLYLQQHIPLAPGQISDLPNRQTRSTTEPPDQPRIELNRHTNPPTHTYTTSLPPNPPGKHTGNHRVQSGRQSHTHGTSAPTIRDLPATTNPGQPDKRDTSRDESETSEHDPPESNTSDRQRHTRVHDTTSQSLIQTCDAPL